MLRACPSGERVIVAKENAYEASYSHMVGGSTPEIIAADTVSSMFRVLFGATVPVRHDRAVIVEPQLWTPEPFPPTPTLADEGVDLVLKTLDAGGPVLWSMPHGSPAFMLAQRVWSTLPALTPEQAAEVTAIHSAMGILPEDGVVRRRPFRFVDPDTFMAGVLGGGWPCRPGDVSLAHHGVVLHFDGECCTLKTG